MEIKKLRAKLGITQDELASKMGLRQSTVSMWEKEKATPSIKTIKKISCVFNIPLEDLIKYFEKGDE